MTFAPQQAARELHSLLSLEGENTADRAATEPIVHRLRLAPQQQVVEFLATLNGLIAESKQPTALPAWMLQALVHRVNDPQRNRLDIDADLCRQLHCLVETMDDPAFHAAALSLLVHAQEEDDLHRFVADLVAAPPQDSQTVGLLMGVLMQRLDYDAAWLFPELMEGIRHPQLAGPVLDLANFLVREERIDSHPAAQRQQELARLLRDITQRLLILEESPPDRPPREIQALVTESTAIAVALCDALALIGDSDGIGPIRNAMQVRHRRLRTEAAAALVRLGEEEGIEALIELAAEPVARLRVLAYAAELDLSEKIDEEFSSSQARAESELALWLAQPEQFGFPPSSSELLDQRTQYWPGYDEPVNCFLFRYNYQLPETNLSNLALVGPLTHGFSADLADLPVDDIYAVFAGWFAEHEEIFEIEIDQQNPSHQADLARMTRRLQDRGYSDVAPLRWGSFLGDRVLIADTSHDDQTGYAVVNADDVLWVPSRPAANAISDSEAYDLYKGRKLLRTFNTGE